MTALTIGELTKLTGVEKRTIDYYSAKEEKGGCAILPYTLADNSKYRLYDETAIRTLFRIRLYRELDYSISEIKAMISGSEYLSKEMLESQIKKLEEKKIKEMNRLDEMIAFANAMKEIAMQPMHLARISTQVSFDGLKGAITGLSDLLNTNLDLIDKSSELARLAIAALNTINKHKDGGFGSSEVQTVIKTFYKRLPDTDGSSFSVVFDYIFNSLEKLYQQEMELEKTADPENMTLDDATIKAMKEAFCICSKWAHETKTLNMVSDIGAFTSSNAAVAIEIDEKYGKGFFGEVCVEFMTDICDEIKRQCFSSPGILESIIYGIGSSEIEDRYGEGFFEFTINAVDAFSKNQESKVEPS